jgi:hypothetical protein
LRNPFSLDGGGGDLGPFDCVSLPSALTLCMWTMCPGVSLPGVSLLVPLP